VPESPSTLPAIAVWADPTQTDFVRASAQAAGVHIALAGSPLKGQSGLVASELGAEPFDDLRNALAEADVTLFWLASLGDLPSGETAAAGRAVLAAKSRGVGVASTEPLPASAFDLTHAGWGAPDDRPGSGLAGEFVRFVALPRQSRVMRDAHEVLAAFGAPRMVQIESWAGPAHGTLGARLLGAMDLVHTLLGDPETIDAAYVGPHGATGVHTLPGETLRDLHGDLTATMRFPDGRAAVLATSNGAGRWNCVVTLISGEGRLRLYDDGFEWIGPDGAKRDELRQSKTSRGKTSPADHAVSAAADTLARLCDPHLPDPGPVSLGSVLCLSQAALLSARTGQPESPHTIRRMMEV